MICIYFCKLLKLSTIDKYYTLKTMQNTERTQIKEFFKKLMK